MAETAACSRSTPSTPTASSTASAKSAQSRALAHYAIGAPDSNFVTCCGVALKCRFSEKATRRLEVCTTPEVKHGDASCSAGSAALCGCSELLAKGLIASVGDCTQEAAIAACEAGKCAHSSVRLKRAGIRVRVVCKEGPEVSSPFQSGLQRTP